MEGRSLTLALGDGEFYDPSNQSAPERGIAGGGVEAVNVCPSFYF